MQEVYEFLKKASVYWLATTEGDQPRVRPFGTYVIYDGKLYIQTGKIKDVSKQLSANPKVEIGAFDAEAGAWIRIAATAVNDDSIEAKTAVLDAYPNLKDRYAADDDNTQVLYLKDATATFSSFTSEPKVVKF
ncbi:MAG: pyridoxamine 5'-phosphate oxidase family protein [Clostridiales Family XIII bacterium]|jgi:uncharacterized pyridoxamine 5'-phosphate oxidase family protein|nr:pyridoxamine 5'-phosphate oxidase family protein [Clostridiales Family XIII bacterium]